MEYKNGQTIAASEAKEIIEKNGVSLVIDDGCDCTETWSIDNVEDNDSFEIMANFPGDAILKLTNEDFGIIGIYIKNQGSFVDNQWVLSI